MTGWSSSASTRRSSRSSARSTASSGRSRCERSTTRSRSTATTASGRRSPTTTGRPSTSSTRRASSATTTSAKAATRSPSGRSKSCSACSASSSPSKGWAWRPRPTGSTSSRPRPTWARTAARATSPRSTELRLNTWTLTGEWAIGRENVTLERAGGSIAYRFSARDAHLVLSPGTHDPIPFRVLLDGQAPGASHGEDVDADGNGVLGDGRLYQLVRQHDGAAERTVEITFAEPGAAGLRVHVRLVGATRLGARGITAVRQARDRQRRRRVDRRRCSTLGVIVPPKVEHPRGPRCSTLGLV